MKTSNEVTQNQEKHLREADVLLMLPVPHDTSLKNSQGQFSMTEFCYN